MPNLVGTARKIGDGNTRTSEEPFNEQKSSFCDVHKCQIIENKVLSGEFCEASIQSLRQMMMMMIGVDLLVLLFETLILAPQSDLRNFAEYKKPGMICMNNLDDFAEKLERIKKVQLSA